MVRTFGIASASYYWSWVAAAVGRLVQYLFAYTSTSWHMLVADDYLLESGGPQYRIGSVLSYYCARDVLEFRQEELSGLSFGRRQLPARRRFTWDPSREGLGRIVFVAGALEHERPFLAPLYKFRTKHPRDSIRRVPPYVSFILKYLSREISLKRH